MRSSGSEGGKIPRGGLAQGGIHFIVKDTVETLREGQAIDAQAARQIGDGRPVIGGRSLLLSD